MADPQDRSEEPTEKCCGSECACDQAFAPGGSEGAGSEEMLPEGERMGIVQEFMLFLVENKAYWLAPIIIVALLLVGLLIAGAATGGASTPFIYTLF